MSIVMFLLCASRMLEDDTAVRLLVVDNQLIRISVSCIGETDSRKQFVHIDLLKYTNAQNGENSVNAGFQSQSTLYDFQKCVHSDGAPDLYFHRVGLAPEEGLDAHVHFEPLEEQLNVPACFIELSNSEGWQVEVVGEKHQELPGFRIPKTTRRSLAG